MIYIRISDQQTVSRDEACDGGVLRAGYKLRVPVIADGQRVNFADAAAGATSLADAALNDALVARDVASAERGHGLRHAYLGDRAPAFTDAMRGHARAASTTALQQRAASIRDGADVLHAETVTLRVMRDAAYAARKIELANAWKH